MPTAIQVLIAVLGILLTAQVTQLLNALKGMRADIQSLIKRLDDEADARHELSERVLVLETEHRAGVCRHKAGA